LSLLSYRDRHTKQANCGCVPHTGGSKDL